MAKIDIMDVAPYEIMGRILAYAEYHRDHSDGSSSATAITVSILNTRYCIAKMLLAPDILTSSEQSTITKVFTLAKQAIPKPKLFTPITVEEFQSTLSMIFLITRF